MQITRSRIQYLPMTILIVVGVLFWVLSCGGVAAADMYTESAHGNNDPPPGYGVNRSQAGYDIGDCANCHETFDDSICGEYQFLLFYDDAKSMCDLFCFTCHSAFIAWQPVTNYPYCVNFGGAPTFYGTIYQQFCDANSTPSECGSRHHLVQIHDSIKNNAVGWGFNSDPNPCVACHNPHADQRNHPAAIVGGKLNTAIRRPSHYKATDPADSLWGDDPSERMDQYASQFTDGVYQPPYYGDTSNPDWELAYEPSGNAIPSDGSDLPDYVTFCLDCHQYQLWDPERNEAVTAIDWSQERHGGYPANTCTSSADGTVKAPYTHSLNSNYVLSCLDCHEPHGTYKRLHLIRRIINGEIVAEDAEPCGQRADICGKCHDYHANWPACWDNSCHGASGEPYKFHGSTCGEASANCYNEPMF